MSPDIVCTPKVASMIKGAARKMAPPGIDRADLQQAAWVELLGAKTPERIEFGLLCRIAYCAMIHVLHRERRMWPDRLKRLDDEDIDERWMRDRPTPEPSPGLVSMLSLLTDREAEALVLINGLDGASPRSQDRVAFMVGRNCSSVRKSNIAALRKMRESIERRAGGLVTIED